jgi:hypothetical protein
MKTRTQPGPLRRMSLRLAGARDAHAGVSDPTPMTEALASVAEGRRELISWRLQQELHQPLIARARLKAERDRLHKEQDVLPESPPVTTVPATAVDQTAVAIRENARTATLRTALTEQDRRLEIEVAGLDELIASKREAAEHQKQVETQYGQACAQIYRAALARHAACRRPRDSDTVLDQSPLDRREVKKVRS